MEEQKTVFVTGGSKGIGASIAEELVQAGYRVIIGYHTSKQQAQLLQKYILEKYNQDINLIEGDLSKEQEVERIIKIIEEKYKTVDILINNAGLSIDTTLDDKTAENFKKILSVNLIAPFLLSKYFGKKMYERGYGKIINISSTNGIDTLYPEGMDYDASKAGLISLTKNFATEFAPFVQVNTVAPGWTNTEMTKSLSQEQREKECEKILLHRFAEPKEIAKVVKFLISDDASYINASIIRVDGGSIQ